MTIVKDMSPVPNWNLLKLIPFYGVRYIDFICDSEFDGRHFNRGSSYTQTNKTSLKVLNEYIKIMKRV